MLISLLIYLIFLPLEGLLADKIGIGKQIKLASLCYLLFSYLVFALLSQQTLVNCIPVLIFFAMIQALLNSALPAFMVNQFKFDQRGKALAISYNLSLTLFAGLMPYLILSSEHQLNPGIPISLCAVLSVLVLNFKGKKYGYLRSKLSH